MTIDPMSTPSAQQDVYLFPASFAQQRLWFLHQVEPQSTAYNLLYPVHIHLALHVQALEQSFNALIARHEVLRTTFVMREGQAMQVIAPELSLRLPVVDLEHLPQQQREAEVLLLANKEKERPFDLAHGPLLRAMLLKLGAQEYLLLVSIHHIIFDGGSIGVFFGELTTFYQAFARDQAPGLPDLPIQYADFAEWQREWLQGKKLEEQLAYWKEQLAGAPTALELPTDHPRPALPTGRGSSYLFSFSKPLSEAFKALSRQEGVSLYMTLLASFATLLSRYAGQEDLLLGTVVSERRRPELQELIGFFLNTLVLRIDLSGTPTFGELLKRVREVVLEAQAHQDVPFEYLVQQLQPERSLSQNPFFQVLLTLLPSSFDLPPGWALTTMNVKTGAAKFDLELALVEHPEGLSGYLEYSTELFEEASIARLVGHWQTLLEGIVAHPEQRLSERLLLPEAERQQLLVDWNATSSPYPKEQSLPQLFEAQVERTPEAVALVYEGQELTYRQLNARANQLAHYLRQIGVGAEVLVGLYMERSPEMVVGLLGILKAGGAYVPLDPAYPKERLAFMLQDAQPTALLTQQHLMDTLPRYEHVVCLDRDWGSIAQQSAENLANSIGGEHLAYLLYTSGSTGQPKGVLGTHRAALNRFCWMWNTYPFEPGEVCCQKTALSFVDAVWEVFGPLLHGVRSVILPDLLVKDPQQLLRTLAAHAVTRLVLVPSLLRVLLDTLESQPELVGHLARLKYCISSGEALPLELAQRFFQRLPHCVLLNLYGSSEVAADATCYDCRHYTAALSSIPIGRPIANTQVYLLDPQMQPVPIGVPGELHVGGDGLARGYFKRPELTMAKFVPHPFSQEPGARLYKTGDRARYLPDGNLEYLGRLDHQVKLRGYRIELDEIESVLAQHPAVREAVVVAREDRPGDQRLVAYIVAAQEEPPATDTLRSSLKEKLPMYMIPAAFVLLESLPLTPNGKVDRRALPPPEPSARIEASFVAPTLMVHHQLTQIWEELLDVRPIGIRDNFFDLGGHSLLAVRLVDRIEQVWGKKISLNTLLAGATIEQLANALLPSEDPESRPVSLAAQGNGSQWPAFPRQMPLIASVKTIWAKLKPKK